jgi:hypothetical protein
MLGAMRGSPAARAAIAASLACLGAWSGCSFGAPRLPASEDAPQLDPDAPPDAPYVPACMTDPSYSNNGGHRYKRLAQDTSYDTAIDRCAADGAHLAVVDDLTENNYLRGLHTADMWIGFDDLTEENVFRWITGATSTFTAWSTNEPNDNGVEDCTYLRPNGTWNDTSCGDQKRPICECDPSYRPPPTPACRTATSGFSIVRGRRYFVRTTPATWQQAKADCESIGAHLLVIGDADENTELDMLLAGPTWLGYTDAAIEGTFRWVNDAPSPYNRWPGSTAPQNDTLDCAVFQDTGSWADAACSDLHRYACECDPLPP